MSKSFNKLSQQLLAKQGFAVEADGKDSDEFRAAIRSFQEREGLKVTETVTEETLSALREEAVPLPRPRPQYVAGALALGQAEGREAFVRGDPGGLIEDGNIDLAEKLDRLAVAEDAGEFAVVRSGAEGHDRGEHFGKFDTPGSARAYAERLLAPDPSHIKEHERDPAMMAFAASKAEAERKRFTTKTREIYAQTGDKTKKISRPAFSQRFKPTPKGQTGGENMTLALGRPRAFSGARR